MSKSKKNVNELLAAISRKMPEAAPEAPVVVDLKPESGQAEGPVKKKAEKASAPTTAKKTKSKIGRAVQFWMHDEDTQLVRELSAWLAGQGVRPSDSMVIRAALRYAKTGSGLLEAYWQASKLDGRLKRD
jgi:GH25 family lysozyme M1 (1,4-beta-N-acetylmuramidase)